MVEHDDFGASLRSLRIHRLHTGQKELASFLGVSQGQISKWEREHSLPWPPKRAKEYVGKLVERNLLERWEAENLLDRWGFTSNDIDRSLRPAIPNLTALLYRRVPGVRRLTYQDILNTLFVYPQSRSDGETVDALDFLALNLPSRGRPTVIIGEPGSGKTLLSLKLASDVSAKGESVLFADAASALRDVEQRFGVLQNMETNQGALLIIDGLDEVGASDQQGQAIEQLSFLCSEYRCLLVSRTEAFERYFRGRLPFEYGITLELQPWTEIMVEQYIRAILRFWQLEGAGLEKKLLKGFYTWRGRDRRSVPLELATFTELYVENPQVMDSVSSTPQLFNRYILSWLTHEFERERYRLFRPKQKLLLLAMLASNGYKDQSRRRFSQQFVEDFADGLSDDWAVQYCESVADWRQAVTREIQNTGLLETKGQGGERAFVHESFYDYLVASMIARSLKFNGSLAQQLFNQAIREDVHRFLANILAEEENAKLLTKRLVDLFWYFIDKNDAHPFAAQHCAYYIGHTSFATRTEVLEQLWKETHRRLASRDETKLRFYLPFRSISISLSYSGQPEYLIDYVRDLQSNTDADQLNLAFSLHFYGDDLWEPPTLEDLLAEDVSKFAPWKYTAETIVGQLRESYFEPIRVIDIYTLIRLQQIAEQQHLPAPAVPWADIRETLIYNIKLLGIRHDCLPENVRNVL